MTEGTLLMSSMEVHPDDYLVKGLDVSYLHVCSNTFGSSHICQCLTNLLMTQLHNPSYVISARSITSRGVSLSSPYLTQSLCLAHSPPLGVYALHTQAHMYSQITPQ